MIASCCQILFLRVFLSGFEGGRGTFIDGPDLDGSDAGR